MATIPRMMNNISNYQKGSSLIAAIFIIVIIAFMGVMFLALVNTGSMTAVNDLQSIQALYLAEGGIEFALESKPFPNYSVAATNLGAGSFSVTTPATTSGLTTTTATTITVNAAPVTNFPPAGAGGILIDSEVITYTGWNGTTFSGATRGANGTTATQHASGNAVYPVTVVSGALNAVNTTIAVPANGTTGFIIPGVIVIDSEYIYCTSVTANSFTSCTRGYNGTSPATHSSGINIFQNLITSIGIAGNAQRGVQVGVAQRTTGIALDVVSATTFTNTNSFSWNHSVSGNNRLLIVGISIVNTTVVSAATYSGIALTIVAPGQNNQNSKARVEIWQLKAPPLGNHILSVTMSGNATGVAGAMSLNEVDQTTPIEASGYATAPNGPGDLNPTVPITTLTNNAWLVDTLVLPNVSTISPGASQIQRWSGTNGVIGAGSTKGPIAPAGPTAMSWTLSVNNRWCIGAVAVKPASTLVTIVRNSWKEVIN